MGEDNKKKKSKAKEIKEEKEEKDGIKKDAGEKDPEKENKENKEDKKETGKKKAEAKKEEPADGKKSDKKSEEDFAELNDKYLRVLAEYDNFRRRTADEKNGIYFNAYKDAVTEILPVIDSLEKAAELAANLPEDDKMAEGILITLKQWKTAMSKLGIAEIDSSKGVKFDPNIHNAVMHEENEELGKNEISDTFQKGYTYGDRVIRFAMVKVAN